jgi:hypothetical protein
MVKKDGVKKIEKGDTVIKILVHLKKFVPN